MAIRITIEQKGLIPGATLREIQTMKRLELQAVAHDWDDLYSDRHYTNQGARIYRMKRRKTKEIFTGKEKVKGAGTRPLVKTGFTERKARRKTVSGTANKSTIHIPVGHINRYQPKGFLRRQLRFEIIKVLKQEERDLAKRAERRLRDRFRRGRRGVTVITESLTG